MTDEPNRCEPPEHLRGVDGWHWVEILGHPPFCARWVEDGQYWDCNGSPDYVTVRRCWRYLAPVPSPEAVARLVEAAERGRELAEQMDYQGTGGRLDRLFGITQREADIALFDAALAPFKEPNT